MVAVVVAFRERPRPSTESLETHALTGAGLLLHGHDLHHLIGELRADEVLHDLVLLNGDGEEVDVLQGLDLALLHQAAELGARGPLVLVVIAAPAAAASSAASTVAPATVTAPVAATAAVAAPVASAEAAAEAASVAAARGSVSHCA